MNPADTVQVLPFWQWAVALIGPALLFCLLVGIAGFGERKL